jgi:TolB-like protein/Tfp pilus assembly protein PilF
MSPFGSPSPIVHFADFELDLRTAELTCAQIKTVLPEQPFRILTLLLEHAGEVVTREALRKELWGDHVFVDFEDSLNSAVRRLRLALADPSKHPQLLETLPRHGYRLKVQARETDSPISTAATCPTTNGFRVAVLPLEDFSDDMGKGYLADSMTDAIITALAKVPDLRVISRTSVMAYKNTRKILPEVARELRADAVVEGAILRAGARVRITMQLIDPIDDQHIWAESYEGELSDGLKLQEEISRAIAVEIPRRLRRWEVREENTSIAPDAYRSYLKGRHLIENTGRNDCSLKRATLFFEQAVNGTPRFAQAYVGLAEAYNASAIFGLLPARRASTKAQQAARKAIEMNASIAEAHATLGYALMLVWRWREAATEFEHAIQLDARSVLAHRWYAEYLMAVGETAKAEREIERALELGPMSLVANCELGFIYYGLRRFEQAARQFRKTMELDENSAVTSLGSGMSYAQAGKYKEAKAEYERARTLGGTVHVLRGFGFLCGIIGEKTRAQQVLEESNRLGKSGCSVAYTNASIYAGLGKKTHAFEWLNKACDDSCAEVTFLKWDPQMDSLRSDPRFHNLLERVGLPR